MNTMKKTDIISKARKQTGHEMHLISVLEQGKCFYTELPAKTVTRYALMYSKKVKTEVCLSISNYYGHEIKTIKLTKVTIL